MWQHISSLPPVLEHYLMWDMRFSWWWLNRIPSSGMGNIILKTCNACCHTHQNSFHYIPSHSPEMFLYIPLYNAATSTTPQNHIRMWRLGATHSQTETVCLTDWPGIILKIIELNRLLIAHMNTETCHISHHW